MLSPKACREQEPSWPPQLPASAETQVGKGQYLQPNDVPPFSKLLWLKFPLLLLRILYPHVHLVPLCLGLGEREEGGD